MVEYKYRRNNLMIFKARSLENGPHSQLLQNQFMEAWNLYKKNVYLKKLQDFNDGVIRFFGIDVQAHRIRSTSSWLSDNFGDGELPELVLQLDLPLEELKVMLLEDKVSVQPENSSSVPSVVLLSAPPGCGKTMLTNMVCRDSTIKDKFKENIFFVTVPKRVTVKVIVQQVFQQKGCLEQLPEVQNDKHAINQLRQLLEGIGGAPDYKPILLVLDDVRSPGMKSLVRMFMFEGIQGYKILVTSRFDPLGFQSVYRLKLLNYQDAVVLFRHYAFLPGRPVSVVPDYLVNEIVKGCKGFPLALTVLGLSLSGKPEVFWKNTLSKWSKGKSDIFESDGELLNNLKTILDVADEGVDMEKVKECFLHLQSLYEDQTIPATLTDSNVEFLAHPRSITVKEGSFCHVFLSFRGEVRNDFTYFLYDALKADGFVPFMDKRDMYAGEDVQLGIEEGIKNSMSSIVIFSKNFAFSSFCLDELMLLLERKRTSKYFIIPIHYGVKSTDVRRQLGTFGEALEKHKANYNEDQIEKWREALTEAGKILGERFDGSVHVPDFIQTFVKVFRKRFADKFPEHPMPSPRIPVPH